MRETYFGKNISMKQTNFLIVQGYMNKTRKNFSQTVNKIIEEWDKFSIMIEKYKRQQLKDQTTEYGNDLKSAKVVK